MINTLYFGAYKDAFEHGLSSASLVNTLSKNENIQLYTRPLLLSQYQTTNNSFDQHEKCSSLNFDIVIQHCPINNLSYPLKKYYNIAIPTNINGDLNKLKNFDLILVDSSDAYDILVKKYSKRVKLFGYDHNPRNIGTYNISLYNNTKKFYFVGDYFTNQHIIQKIIVSFNIAFRSNNDCSLLLFLNNQNDYEKHLESFIKDIKKKLKIKNDLNKEIIICDTLANNVYSAHKTGNILINIHDTNISNYHEHVAEYCGNQIINMSDVENILVPAIDDPNYYPGYNKKSAVTDSMIEVMKSSYTHKNKFKKIKYKDQPSINTFLNVK